MITFNVDDVIGKDVTKFDYDSLYAKDMFKKYEAYKFNGNSYVLDHFHANSFIKTALISYRNHHALTLSPDDVWLIILQAISKYIEANPEEARKSLVNFEGKKELTIETDFVKEDPNNDWERAFEAWGDKIEESLGKKRKLFDEGFSTTTSIERAAIRVQMMGALSPYFSYRMMTLCGIPTITLLGEISDWESIFSRVKAFRETLPSWISDSLEFASEQFLMASKGEPDLEFWRNFIKTSGGSGGTPIGGFINCLFPYIGTSKKDVTVLVKNPVLEDGFKERILSKESPRRFRYGNDVGDFGASSARVPFQWNYYGTLISMELIAGILGSQVYDNSYKPLIGFAVREIKDKK